MSPDTITGADLVARRLAKAGIRLAFGMPGGEVLALVAALDRAGIRFVLTRHETAAGFMAEGVWHATGAPALLVTTIGPGLTNAVNVIANAHQDRVPMIVISGCVDAALAESYTHQVIDHGALMRPITKARFRAQSGTEDIVTDKALAIALKGRPGPVHVDLPIMVAEARQPDRPLLVSRTPEPGRPADLGPALDLAARSRQPLIIAGLDVANTAGSEALTAFAERIGAPVLTTYKAKGVLPPDHPLHLGAIGLSPKADAIVKPLIEWSDLIILAGYDPIEMRQSWRNPWPAGKPVIDLVAEALPHGMHGASLTFEGDVAVALRELTAALPPVGATWPSGELAAMRQSLKAAFAAPNHGGWGPHQVFATVRECSPIGTVASADSGAHRILLSQMWPCEAPLGLIQSSGFCTMGGALPLAAGHAFATRRHTLCFVGDAGLEMVLGEIATLRDHQLPVVIICLVDSALALIELKQRQMQLPRIAVDFGATDFAAVAGALGGHGVTVSSTDELARETHAAFARDGFTLIAARIGDRAYEGAF
ncbi:MAG: thiamine pyrophosphate-binding protein [Hyphomicrobiales bacterium]|nr:thiamine pyrophosphate-binding protein [Hyphomicrobiales bacterium]